MSKYSALVHSAATRRLLEKKIKSQTSASSLGGTLGDIQSLTAKVDAVQSNLGSIAAALTSLASQVNLFQNITDGLQDSLADIENAVNAIIDSALTKYSYILEDGSEGVISYENDGECITCVVENPLQSKDIIVQVVDTDTSDEIVGVSVEIDENNVTLKMAICDEEGQYRAILMG